MVYDLFLCLVSESLTPHKDRNDMLNDLFIMSYDTALNHLVTLRLFVHSLLAEP